MKESKKFFSLMSDTTFKYLLKNPKTRFFFKDIIYFYTGMDIDNFTLIDNELSTGNKYVSYRVDTLLVNEENNVILNIELNRKNEEYTELRNRRYLHTLAGTSKDSSYTDKKIVVQLNLNGFSSTRRENIAKETFQLYDKENDIIIEDFIIHNVFLSKESEICYNKSIRSSLQLFLCNSYEEMEKVVEKNKELKIIMDEIERLNKDKFFGGLYNVEEEQRKMEDAARSYGFNEGLSKGRTIGLQEGEAHKTKEIALKMLEKGISKEDISEIVNLKLEELDNIIKGN